MFRTTAPRFAAFTLLCTALVLLLGGCKPAPSVVSTNPADGATEVSVNTAVIAALSGEIHGDTINASTFTLRQGTTPVAGTVGYDEDSHTATFTPSAPLLPETVYTATLAKGAGAEKSVSKCNECTWPFVAVPIMVGIIAALASHDEGLPADVIWSFTTEKGGPPPNAAPVANAGPDQFITLAPGVETAAVTLDGSGSSDADKSIVLYTWTGTPDPEDVVSPVLQLGSGVYVFTLVVTDDKGASSGPSSLTVTVNAAPVADADAGPDQNINIPPGATTVTVTLDGSRSTDSDGTVVGYTWTGDPDPEDIMSPTVTVGPGVHVFTLVVTDNLGASSFADSVTVTVNAPPVANAGPDQTVTVPPVPAQETKAGAVSPTAAVTLDGSASYDSDGTIVSYTWTGPVDPEDTATPTVLLVSGDYTFSLVVTDDKGAVSVADTVEVRVNVAPHADAGPDRQLNLPAGQSTVDVTLDASGSGDPDGTISVFAWSGTPDPADTSNPMVALGAGAHTFTLVVTDNDGAASTPDTVTISVNAAPVANAGADRLVQLPLGATTVDVTLDASGSTDSDGTIAVYAWTGIPDPADTVNPTVTLGAGTHVFGLVVTDDKGSTSLSDTVSIRVNAPPVASADGNQAVNLPLGATTVEVTLDGSGSTDSDGTVVGYTWTGVPDPADTVNPTVTLGAGVHTFTLVVTDNDGGVSAADTVTTVVNVPPVADAGPDQQVNILPGETTAGVLLDGSGSTDSDGFVTAYSWNGVPNPSDAVNPALTLGPGVHTFTLVVTDNSGAVSEADTVTIFVNASPTANAGPDRLINLAPGETSVNVTLDGSGSSDSDGTIVSYAWTGVPDPADTAGPTVALGAGVHTFSLTVTDDKGATSAADTVTITVNAAPVADAGPDRAINIEPGASTVDVTLDGSGSTDSDGTILAYAWTGVPDPADTVNPTVTLGSGEHTFTLYVLDNNGAASAADTVTISVNAAPVADAGPDQRVNLPLSLPDKAPATVDVTLDGSGSTDSDGTVASYAWTGVPDAADTVNPTVTLGAGEHTFTLVVTDNDGATSAADTVTIFVNIPPLADAGADRQINLAAGASTVDVILDGTLCNDPDGTIASYAWTGTPDPNDTQSPTVTLGAGVHTFTLVVTDNDGASSAPDTVTISVNAAPVADAGTDQLVTLPIAPSKVNGPATVDVTLDGSGSTDSDGTVSVYTWTGMPDPADTVNPTVTLGPGVYTFTLTVTDELGGVSAPDSVTVTVNIPPVADAGAYRQIDLPAGQTETDVVLDGSGSSDADGSIASYTWTGTPDPADTESPTVTLGPGTHTFFLTVTDDRGAAGAPASVTVFVNQSPVANAGPDQDLNLPLYMPAKGVGPGSTVLVTLDGSGSLDPDGSIAAYTWTGVPDPDDTVSPSLNLGAGTHVFTLVVTDNSGAVSAADTVTIRVNTPPVALVTGAPNPVYADTSATPTLTYDTSVLYGLQQNAQDFLTIDHLDPADGSVTESVPVTLAGHDWRLVNGFGLAVDPTTGTMWALIQGEEAFQPTKADGMHLILATLDPDTGAAHFVAEYTGGPMPYDLTCTEDGTLVAMAGAEGTYGIYIADKTDGSLVSVYTVPDSSGFDAIAYIVPLQTLAHAYRTTEGVSVIEGIDPVTLTPTPLPPALPAEAYNFLWPTALAVDTDTLNLYLSEDVDMTGRLSTVAVTEDGGVETLLQDGNSIYGGLAFGYRKSVPSEIVQLDGSGSSDADGDTIASYTWSVISAPVGSAVTGVSDGSIVNPTLAPDVPGIYLVQLVVNDGKVDSLPDTYMVTYANTAPVAEAGPEVIAGFSAGWTVAFLDGTGSYDADYDRLLYAWTVTDSEGNPVPGFFVPGETSAVTRFTFSESLPGPGPYTATLTVTEDKPGGLSATDTTSITVDVPQGK